MFLLIIVLALILDLLYPCKLCFEILALQDSLPLLSSGAVRCVVSHPNLTHSEEWPSPEDLKVVHDLLVVLKASFIFQPYTDSLTIDPRNRVQIPRCFMLWTPPSCLSQLEAGLVQHCVPLCCQGTNRELVLFVMMTVLVVRSTGKVITAIAVQH